MGNQGSYVYEQYVYWYRFRRETNIHTGVIEISSEVRPPLVRPPLRLSDRSASRFHAKQVFQERLQYPGDLFFLNHHHQV